jgi:hypothetical protein
MNFVLVGSKVYLFLEGRQCCDEVSWGAEADRKESWRRGEILRKTKGKRRVSSSVAKSFGHDRDLPLRLLWSSSLLQEDIEERERESKNWRDNQSLLFVRNCVRGQCLCSRIMYIICEWDPNIFSDASVCKAWPELCVVSSVVLLRLSVFKLQVDQWAIAER